MPGARLGEGISYLVPASQALCKGIIAVISASTVWSIKFLMYYKKRGNVSAEILELKGDKDIMEYWKWYEQVAGKYIR